MPSEMKFYTLINPRFYADGKLILCINPQSYTGSDNLQGPPVAVVGPITCPRSHSTRAISNAKIKTVKLTVVVVAGYLICSAPYVCIQLYVVLGNPDSSISKYINPWGLGS